MQKQENYYKVTVARGHCGSGKSLDITFYFKARDAYDAICRAKRMPSVKHGKIPMKVEQITQEEYIQGRQQSAYHKEGQEMFKSSMNKQRF